MGENIHKFYSAKYFSELNLCKVYCQILLTYRAKSFTAFPSHQSLMEFCHLLFIFVTACATYICLMRLVLMGLPNLSML